MMCVKQGGSKVAFSCFYKNPEVFKVPPGHSHSGLFGHENKLFFCWQVTDDSSANSQCFVHCGF